MLEIMQDGKVLGQYLDGALKTEDIELQSLLKRGVPVLTGGEEEGVLFDEVEYLPLSEETVGAIVNFLETEGYRVVERRGSIQDGESGLNKREYSQEYLNAVLEKVKHDLPDWLYRELHKIARASAGGRAKARRRMEDLGAEFTAAPNMSKSELELSPEDSLPPSDTLGTGNSDDSADVVLQCSIVAKAADKQQVFGWFSVVEKDGEPVTDRQGDMMDEDEMERMSYQYVMESRTAGEMHKRKGVGTLIESMAFTKEKQVALGIDLGKVGWWAGFHISDDDVWKSIKSGEYTAFSIHGKGHRRKLES